MTYPFGAVVGMDDMRLALLLNAVSPAVGGVLVRGEKGTAKSTTVRALAAVLPPVDVVAGCRFACDPAAPDPECPDGPHSADDRPVTRPAKLVELPVGASEDRLVGSLDLERALTEGVKSFEPGLLAGAHRGVLYVDEVNLLHDHLVDLLLDAAALGRAYVEREGVSVRHAARFLLVGTMNPEEGELRPQLLDRFGLTVEVAAPRDADLRAEVVRRRFGYDADPAGFAAAWAVSERELADQIAAARALLPSVVLSDAALRQVTSVCAAFDVDGLRADLVTARAAIAHAAWCGRTDVTEDDVRVAARLALPHRRRRNPFDAPGLDEETLDQALEDSRPDSPPDDDPTPPEGTDPTDGDPTDDTPDGNDPPGGPTAGGPTDGGTPGGQNRDFGPSDDGTGPDGGEQGPTTAPRGEGGGHTDAASAPEKAAVAPDAAFRVQRLEVPGIGAGAAGRRSRARSERGRVVGSRRPEGSVTKLHLVDTVLAAAPHQRARGRTGTGLRVERDDLRQATLEGREGNLVLFVVDASGSMGARSRMAAVKGAVLSLLMDAYQRRDKVGLITFRGGDAELTLPPTWSVEAAAARLTSLPTGGRTPLAAGLLRAHETLRLERVRDPQRRPLLVVVTDGRATGPRGGDHLSDARRAAGLLAAAGTASVVVDCESGPVRLGLAASLGTALGAQTMRLEELGPESLVRTVREAA
ncbi:MULTISPECIES: putative cobaltochelatase [unclassified Modestobacter]|uniref:putative cobaltochelatase n=1 Tax=unclassified Modestobacter TaxID=2643866 RepID=UPI0022AB086E|nr:MULTISPECIES: putative cobaltochelatase [unclassified Modestobacter]MCZ2825424.1 putative cobaltochelatase [Modestobacter sp. VKM Ac-2981]MCZ2853511.1 putative cobaltochelatase [Modestobacter sp. VKM Ac-2982]